MPDSHADSHSTLDLSAVIAALGGTACRFDIDALASCDSSNSRLLARAESGAPSGTVLVADQQTAGRGRRGRTWHGSPGDSLTFSLLWRFPPESSAPTALSLTVGLALARAMTGLGAADVRLKWPNDLLCHGRKLGGILIELQPGALRTAIIGIGINLHLPHDLPQEVAATAISLAEGGAVTPTRAIVLAACLQHLCAVLDDYAANGFAPLQNEWQAKHAWQGEQVVISGASESMQGICRGVDTEGGLLLETASGLRRIVSGDVSLRRTNLDRYA